MAIIDSVYSGIKGERGDQGVVASGVLVDIALDCWSLPNGRVLLDDVCCDNFVSTSGIDPNSTVHFYNNYCESLFTSSGTSFNLSLGWSPIYTSSITNQIYQLNLSGTPSARENTVMVYSSDDNCLFLFGGNDGVPKSGLWKFDCSNNSWQQITNSGSWPPARDNHAMIYNSFNRSLVLFGGQVASGTVNDTWVYSVVSGTWSQSTASGIIPGVRLEHSAVYDPFGNQMIVWGGRYGTTYYNEMHQLSFVNNYWAKINDSSGPVARSDLILAYDTSNRNLILFGGNTTSTIYGDVWIYTPETNIWAQRQSLSDGQQMQAGAFDTTSCRLVCAGGQYSSGVFSFDTIVYDNNANICFNILTVSGSLVNMSSTWNSNDKKLYLFGGKDNYGNLHNDLLVYEHVKHTTSSGIQIKITDDSNHFVTAGWSHLDSITPTQYCAGLSFIYYAFSFDQRNTWKIYKSSGWYEIVRNNSGVWQYRDLVGAWQTPSTNNIESTLGVAFTVLTNQGYCLSSDAVRQVISALPTMYSNTTPAPASASASSIYNTTYDAWCAFGGTNPWSSQSTSTNQWVQIDVKVAFRPYAWRWKTSNTTYAPKRFKLQGYNSSTASWDDLDTTYFAADYPQRATDLFTPWFLLSTTSEYSIYRMHVVSGYSATYVYIDQIEVSNGRISPLTMTRSHWEASGGFVPSTTKSIDVAAGLKLIDAVPSVTGVTAKYTISETPMVLITQPWQSAENNPTTIQCVIKCKFLDAITLNTDIKVWASNDNGINYEQITSLFTIGGYGGFTYIVGEKRDLIPHNNNFIRLKVTVHNYKNLLVYGVCTGVDY